jgi:hypothetical protein
MSDIKTSSALTSLPAISFTAPVKAPKPDKNLFTPNFAELGQTGLKRFSGRIYDEFLVNLQVHISI